MKHIPPVPPINSPKEDKLAYRVARCNPKTYGGSYDPMELEGLIGKTFIVIEVLKEKLVNIRTFYLIGEVDI